MYEITAFKVSEGVTIKDAATNCIQTIVNGLEKDFNLRDVHLTLSRSADECEEMEIAQEESEKELPSWFPLLNEVKGFVYWTEKSKMPTLNRAEVVASEEKPDGSVIAKYEALEIDDKQGYVLLKDNKAIVPYIVLPMSVFVPYADKIVSLLNQHSATEDVNITALVSPGLYVEVYPG